MTKQSPLRLVEVIRRRGRLCLWALLLFCTAAPAWAQETFGPTRLGMPVNVSNATNDIDVLYKFIYWLTTIVFVVFFVTMIVFLVRYRHRPGRRAAFVHGHNRLEIVWTLVPTIIMVLIAVFSQSIWAKHKYINQMPVGQNVVEVKVVARQFQWFFHYPGEDGKFGRTNVLWRQNTGDPAEEIGLMRGYIEDFLEEDMFDQISDNPGRAHLLEADDAADDDIVTPVLTVPINRKVHVQITSKDVLHSFFLPYFRVKQDAVPGLIGHFWFESNYLSADIMGVYANGDPKPFDIICAELCGAQHYMMRGQLFVVTEQAFEKWLREQAPEVEEDEQYEDE